MLSRVLIGDVEITLEDRKLAFVDVEFVVVVGQCRRLISAVSAAEKLTLHLGRPTFLVVAGLAVCGASYPG